MVSKSSLTKIWAIDSGLKCQGITKTEEWYFSLNLIQHASLRVLLLQRADNDSLALPNTAGSQFCKDVLQFLGKFSHVASQKRHML